MQHPTRRLALTFAHLVLTLIPTGMKHRRQEWLVRVGEGPLDMARDSARAGRRAPICSGLEREFRALSEAMRNTRGAHHHDCIARTHHCIVCAHFSSVIQPITLTGLWTRAQSANTPYPLRQVIIDYYYYYYSPLSPPPHNHLSYHLSITNTSTFTLSSPPCPTTSFPTPPLPSPPR